MRFFTRQCAVTSLFLFTVTFAHAAPEVLNETQLDQVTAGGQYSYVEGGGTAEMGFVLAKANTKAIEKPNGTTVTKATLKVKAVGTNVDAYGYGESGANDIMAAGYGEGSVDQGKVVIKVKTISKVQADGDVIVKNKVQVRAVERGGASGGAARF